MVAKDKKKDNEVRLCCVRLLRPHLVGGAKFYRMKDTPEAEWSYDFKKEFLHTLCAAGILSDYPTGNASTYDAVTNRCYKIDRKLLSWYLAYDGKHDNGMHKYNN